jgi:Ca-activated chloride channel family protein
MKSRRPLLLFLASVGLAGAALAVATIRVPNFWSRLDRRGDRLLRAGRFAAAAEAYADPYRRGVALYRAGEFKQAAAAFATVGTPEAAFDCGNSLVMLGKYDDAIMSYDRALSLRRGWRDCEENRAVAAVRRDRLKTTGGDETGGQVKADKIVFEKGKNPSTGQQTDLAGGDLLDDAQLRGLWLRRVQTKPADFLRSKFAFQVQSREKEMAP